MESFIKSSLSEMVWLMPPANWIVVRLSISWKISTVLLEWIFTNYLHTVTIKATKGHLRWLNGKSPIREDRAFVGSNWV